MELNSFNLCGKSTMLAWNAGAIPHYLSKGFTLKQAQKAAWNAGALRYSNVVNNLIVSSGKQLIAELMIDAQSLGLTYHAIGTGTDSPSASDTVLGAEGARKPWTSRTITGAVVNLSVFYTAAESNLHIQECGVFGGDAASETANSGKLFSHYLQEHDNSGGLMDLTFDYQVTIT